MNKFSYVKKSINKRREWLKSLKDGKECKRCKQIFPHYCMDYHHKDKEIKEFNIGNGSYRNSKEKIIKEIEKCDLYCSNCHRIIHEEIAGGR